ncbi:MAG: tetratricopeptide repeat protein [Cyanobacteria bacterium J06597_16]
METPNFIIWAVVVFGIAGFAIVSMVNAFRTPITVAPFPNSTVDSPGIPLADLAMTRFVGAVGTYKAGDYRGAIEQLTTVIEQEPNCAEAWHNVGLAYANVGDNSKAVRSLLKASDLYDQQATKEGLDRIKRDLEILKNQG